MTTNAPEQTKLGLTFTPEYEVTGCSPTTLSFNARLAAPEVIEETGKRSAISLTAVIDKSGSMKGKKLALVKHTCAFLLNQLSSNDKLGLVEYDTFVNELIPLSRTSDTFKTEAATVISRMETGSCTNLSGGLFEGLKQQQKNKFIDWDKSQSMPASTPAAPSADPLDQAVASGAPNAPAAAPLAPAAPSSETTNPLAAGFSTLCATVQQTLSQMTSSTPPPPPPPPPPQQQQQQSVMLNRSFQRRNRSGAQHFAASNPTKSPFFVGRAGTAEDVEEDAVRSVFLFTDGLANDGITQTSELVAKLGQLLDESSKRVRVYTFGFGDDHSADMLGKLALVGAGTYYYMEREDSIPTAFADALGGLLSVAAQNVKVEFTPGPGVTVSGVHCGYTVGDTDGGGRSIAVGDMFSEETKDLIVDVELGEREEEGDVSIGTLVVSYLDVVGASLERTEVDCRVKRVKQVPEGRVANEGVVMHKARMETAAGLADARKAAEEGRYEEARARLKMSLARVDATCVEGGMKCQLQADLKEAMENMVDRGTYMTKGSKLMWAKGNAHMQQRCCALSDDEEDEDEEAAVKRKATTYSYANSAQKSMRAKAKSISSR
eukprot:CAMPEP_0181310846 /NCGR_PEP_ID=MMETSP1101-20121128/12810_1 /TAXON_ID=46948 /ORGANISM="Rhodomonas abbreviata, Strain Caron Lab Isolate" /LENGTH=603 /DNA_ID=CAMNT_0023417515 /DNA_START=73 /DNA_END=1884 /DNA_ORIENTATION=+